MRRRACTCLLALIAISALGCDTRPKIVRERPRGVRGGDVVSQAPAKRKEEAPATAAAASAAAAPALTAAEAEEKEKEKPRDFSKELLAQMGGSVSCLRVRPSDTAPRALVISLSALVSVSGRVTRGDASSGQLDATELACMRQRVEAATFGPPYATAPFSVSAMLTLKQEAQPAAAQPVAPPSDEPVPMRIPGAPEPGIQPEAAPPSTY